MYFWHPGQQIFSELMKKATVTGWGVSAQPAAHVSLFCMPPWLRGIQIDILVLLRLCNDGSTTLHYCETRTPFALSIVAIMGWQRSIISQVPVRKDLATY